MGSISSAGVASTRTLRSNKAVTSCSDWAGKVVMLLGIPIIFCNLLELLILAVVIIAPVLAMRVVTASGAAASESMGN
jgi:uncharacterized membrane protein